MPTHWIHKVLFTMVAAGLFALPAVLLTVPELADSNTTLMQRLPAFNKFQCALCHTSASPTQESFGLNNFGDDFLANGNVWNAALASKNSDGDRCTNGFELGDENGDGIFDHGAQVVENSNPGVPDCTLPVDPVTWGVIKEIFARELPNQ